MENDVKPTTEELIEKVKNLRERKSIPLNERFPEVKKIRELYFELDDCEPYSCG